MQVVAAERVSAAGQILRHNRFDGIRATSHVLGHSTVQKRCFALRAGWAINPKAQHGRRQLHSGARAEWGLAQTWSANDLTPHKVCERSLSHLSLHTWHRCEHVLCLLQCKRPALLSVNVVPQTTESRLDAGWRKTIECKPKTQIAAATWLRSLHQPSTNLYVVSETNLLSPDRLSKPLSHDENTMHSAAITVSLLRSSTSINPFFQFSCSHPRKFITAA